MFGLVGVNFEGKLADVVLGFDSVDPYMVNFIPFFLPTRLIFLPVVCDIVQKLILCVLISCFHSKARELFVKVVNLVNQE